MEKLRISASWKAQRWTRQMLHSECAWIISCSLTAAEQMACPWEYNLLNQSQGCGCGSVSQMGYLALENYVSSRLYLWYFGFASVFLRRNTVNLLSTYSFEVLALFPLKNWRATFLLEVTLCSRRAMLLSVGVFDGICLLRSSSANCCTEAVVTWAHISERRTWSCKCIPLACSTGYSKRRKPERREACDEETVIRLMVRGMPLPL